MKFNKKLLSIVIFCNITNSFNIKSESFAESWSGKDYNENSSLQFDAAAVLLAKYKFNPTSNFLDIGCGNGKITAEIAKQIPNGKIIGVDSAPDMITFAQKNYKSLNIEFKNIDVCNISFKQEFDHVFSFSCLHWVKHLDKAFNNIANSLKANGKLLVLMELKNDYPLVKALVEILNAYNLEIDWYSYTPQEITKWLTASDFKSIELCDFHIKKKFKDKEDFRNWIASFPYGFNFEKTKRDKMINEIVEKYINYHPLEADGSLFVIFPETVISAIKK
ncbi:MAG: class I SAM-dependent methyltransferase [Candidatus Babeliales bacterium]|nr:class I SAM-dependent methyltransferase [Candidatus Babeliales bacterium]